MNIQKAIPEDNEVLTRITKASKAYWGYSDAQIEAWSGVLTVTVEYIQTHSVYKLVINDSIAGYYSFSTIDDGTIKLDNLFLQPVYIGKGLGRFLINNLLLRLSGTFVKKIILDAEPHAEAFYKKIGFVKTGQTESSIKDRYLPVMELEIISGNNA